MDLWMPCMKFRQGGFIKMVNYINATDLQIELADNARKILEKELKPRIPELEHADGGLGQYPMDVMKTMAEAGYAGMNIPEEYGGLGLDLVTQAVIVEEMCKVEAGFGFSFFNGANYFPFILLTGLSREEKQSWAERIISGDAIGCFALTEESAGSDAAAMKTTAVRDGDDWILNGTKCFITNAPISNYFLIVAWTDKTKSAGKGISMFFVEKERGVQIGKKERKMGMKLSETAEVILDDVRVPADHMIGEEGRGFKQALQLLNQDGRIFDAVGALGIAEAALDAAVEYAKTRRQFGKRIIDHEGLGFLIADMQIRTEASRALLFQTAEAMAAGKKTGHLTSSVKTFVTDSAMQTTIDAVQVLGGYGYSTEYPVEKLMRDAKIYQIFGGTNQIQRQIIERDLAGRDPKK